MLSAQLGVGRCADRRVLRRDGTATKEIARAVFARVVGDAFPEQAEDDEVAVLRMNTRAPQLNHFRAQRFEDLKLKFLRAVVAQTGCGVDAGLETVRADDIGRWQMFNDEMIANGIERVFVQPGDVRLFQPFVEFEIEDLKAQRLRGADFVRISGKPRGIMGR